MPRKYTRKGRGLKQSGGTITYPYAYPGAQATAAAIAARLRKRATSGILGSARANFPRELAYRRMRTATRLMQKRKQGVAGGDYSQFTEVRLKTGSAQPKTLMKLYKEVRQKVEPSIFRYGGMLQGPGANGFFWCNKQVTTNADFDLLPLYMYDLTAVNNVVNGVYTPAKPFYRAKMAVADGSIVWDYVDGVTNLGSSGALSSDLIAEKVQSTSSLSTMPHEKSRLLYSDVRLNLYGSKSKAIKWVIQVVKILDDALDPIPTNAPTSASQPYQWQTKNSFYQAALKQYTYNPLALTGAEQFSRRIKILKTFTHILQPTSTTESDVNPHCKILKWFMRWDRDLNYEQRGSILTSGSAFNDDSDWAGQTNQVSTYVKPNQKIFLMIRCNDYSPQAQTNDNTKHGSFDMTVRVKHAVQ